MTEERAQQIVNEVTIALDTAERFVKVEDSLPFGMYAFVSDDPLTKHSGLRLRRAWLDTVDEDEFRFGAASLIVLADREKKRTNSLTDKLLVFVGITPIVGLALAGDNVPGPFQILAWIAAVACFAAIIAFLTRQAIAETKGGGFKEALELTGDYEAAKRFVLNADKWAGMKLKPKPEHTAKALALLDEAARQADYQPRTRS